MLNSPDRKAREERIAALRDEVIRCLVWERDYLDNRVRELEREVERLEAENLGLRQALVGNTPMAHAAPVQDPATKSKE